MERDNSSGALTCNLKFRFSRMFREALRLRYGRLPSAAWVTREFNSRCPPRLFVSQESTRKWLKGNALPQNPRLKILADWLDLNISDLFAQCDLHQKIAEKIPPVEYTEDASGPSGPISLNQCS